MLKKTTNKLVSGAKEAQEIERNFNQRKSCKLNEDAEST